MKRTRDAFFYTPAKPGQDFQCGTCRFFMSKKRKCAPMAGEPVQATWSCNGYGVGTPTDDQPITNSWTPMSAGLVQRSVRCENCQSAVNNNRWCQLYDTLNRTLPLLMNLDPNIEPKACCAAQVPK